MMRWIIGTSLKLRFLVVVGASMLMFFGVTFLLLSVVFFCLRHLFLLAYESVFFAADWPTM